MKNIDKDRLQMYVSIVRITIVLCWLSLFAFWIVKLFCNEVFEIAVQNENFIRFSELLQNTWLKYLVSFATISVSSYLMLGAVLQNIKLRKTHLISYIFLCVTSWIVANFVNVPIIKLLWSYTVVAIIAIVFNTKLKKLFGFLCIALDFVFCTLSMITRNIDIAVLSNYFVALILSIDMYIMYALYYLYANLLKLKGEMK